MSFRILILALLFGPACGFAQSTAPLITNVEHRSVVPLNGAWHAIVDPYDTGLRDYRAHVRAQDGFFQNAKPRTAQDLVEYDFDKSETLSVPGDWNTQRPGLLFMKVLSGTRRRLLITRNRICGCFCMSERRTISLLLG